MTDWTTIITTLGAAAIAAAGGWYGARKTAQVSLQAIRAENERLREQHREDHLRNRQTTYHLFLTADRDLENMLTGEMPHTAEEQLALYREWRRLAIGCGLFGTEEVRRRSQQLFDEYMSVGKEIDARSDLATITAAFRAHQSAISKARESLIEAMRADVAPETRDESKPPNDDEGSREAAR